MQAVEITIAVVGIFLSSLTFIFGRIIAGNQAGREIGKMTADITYIKEVLDRMESRWKDEFKRLEGRVDEHSIQIGNLCTQSVRALDSTASAHKRIDELRGKAREMQ